MNPRVVAIGASAGGLDAFQRLIKNLPSETGMAFVLLSHILRGSRSLLPEILAHSTSMNVQQVVESTKLVANEIYVLPPDKFMEIRDGTLHLVPRPARGANDAIDHFLYSLAEDRAQGSIGIVLSGEGSDGARGLKNLKEQSGGITIAQQPASAASQSMPNHAIEIDHIDHVLTPEAIAKKLASMAWCDLNLTVAPLKVLWLR
jgi:two-component system, chemotaxis family, CheB/CheR fusion protein